MESFKTLPIGRQKMIKRFNESIIKKSIISLSILILLLGCSQDPKQEFLKKKKIGILSENQGMVTFLGNLYEDSTFYIPDDGFTDYAYGTFRKVADSIQFKITSGGHLFDPIWLRSDSTGDYSAWYKNSEFYSASFDQ